MLRSSVKKITADGNDVIVTASGTIDGAAQSHTRYTVSICHSSM
jgi:hypothetical protein